MTRLFALYCAAFALTFAAVLPASAQDTPPPAAGTEAPVSLQLNKLEDADGNCRAYFIVDNQLPEALQTLQLDTFIFDPDGVIQSRVALTFQGIRAAREKVALFDFGTPCTGIGRFLINEVLSCEAASGPSAACVNDLATVSITPAALDY